ncbi:alpha-1,2-mannosyltransferase alg9 [Acrodontium crateriforme]|uniref:Mannosyltransferase n=1 Tax=Acrodontium crateriforme TaxID=150365 RepID=A0AAQ3M586_9PEZI|nr:alpha-1,2-mannosyltransferase alg9 [Acrodontium crateriforme]
MSSTDINDGSMRQRFKASNVQSSPSPAIPKAPHKKKQPLRQPINPPYHVEPIIAFYVLFFAHVIAAVLSPIQDCDEVFNYWEPTHYLTHGHGFQTWEYSPDFAIRSWAYTGVHALITLVGRVLPFLGGGKAVEFYGVRIALGFVCALCETRLFSKISAALNPRIAVTFLIIMATSPGMFHASVAYLPSSFAMYFTALGMAAFMDWLGGLRTAQGIFCFGAGAFLGWPFAAAMAIPFLLEEVVLGSLTDTEGFIALFWRTVDGIVRTLLLVAIQMAVDGFFYKKIVLVPWNIVLYNVFSGSGGPDLYGTEPWHFYLRNLFLNFHVWLLLALASMPLLFVQHFSQAKGATRSSWLRGVIFLSPFYIWLAIFTLQPHKEERFMYPAYPALALNAAMALHIILANIGSTDPKDSISKIPIQLRFMGILGFMAAALFLSVFRIIGTMTAFHAPLAIYQPLHDPGMSFPGDTVCLGKEWYRFPSHFFLPADVEAKFVKSEFSGLLPGEFSKANQGFGLFPGTWLVPPGMNDQNREDIGKYTDLKHCNFLVDSHLPSTEITKLEPNYASDTSTWEKVKCLLFLDASKTGIVGRLGWLPDLPFIPATFRRVHGEYCLLKRKKKAPQERMNIPSIETLS